MFHVCCHVRAHVSWRIRGVRHDLKKGRDAGDRAVCGARAAEVGRGGCTPQAHPDGVRLIEER